MWEMSVSIRQAACSSLHLHCCRHFTHLVVIWIHFCTTINQRTLRSVPCNEFEVLGKKEYWHKYIYQTRNEWIQNGWTSTCKINSWLPEYKAAVSASALCVYVFWSDSNAACKTGIVTIHSLDFQTFLRSLTK